MHNVLLLIGLTKSVGGAPRALPRAARLGRGTHATACHHPVPGGPLLDIAFGITMGCVDEGDRDSFAGSTR